MVKWSYTNIHQHGSSSSSPSSEHSLAPPSSPSGLTSPSPTSAHNSPKHKPEYKPVENSSKPVLENTSTINIFQFTHYISTKQTHTHSRTLTPSPSILKHRSLPQATPCVIVLSILVGRQADMLTCLGPSSSAAKANHYTSPATSQGYSVNNTPISSALTSPAGTLTREYTLVVNGPSYGEIWNVIHPNSDSEHNVEVEQVDFYEDPEFLWQVLQPSHSHVEEALSLIIPDAFTKLITSYFEHTENTSRICLLLYQSVHRARLLYIPLYNLLDVLPADTGNGSHLINQSQCDWAFNVFLQYDSLTNPLPPSDAHNFDDIRDCFSELRRELDQHLHKSHTKSHVTSGSTLSSIGAGFGAARSSVVAASRTLISVVASPLCPKCLPSKITKEEVTHLSHLDAAAKGTYVLHHYLETIDRLVIRLYSAIESDKLLIRLGLERGRDIYPIQEIIRQLRKTLPNFLNQLTDLEEHICLCFATINRARKLLLDEIYFQTTREP